MGVIATRQPPPIGRSDVTAVVARARAGEAAARAELFERFAPSLSGMLARLLRSVADAEDALQDTFLIAFEKLDRLHDDAGIEGWLMQIAVFQAHRRFRRRRFLRLFGLDHAVRDVSLQQLATPAVSPEVRAELGLLDELLEQLPIADRVPWMLRYVEGYELAEVAIACRCSLATAKRRIAAAQARIAAHVKTEDDDG
jgi:RNA polymerase sigma-70 factor (ECF subfamily)